MLLSSQVLVLIKDKGQTFSVRRPVQTSGYSTASGKAGQSFTDVTSTAKGLFLQYNAREIDGTVIKTGDVKLFVDPSSMPSAPEIDDLVTSDRTLKVMSVQKQQEGSNVTVWVCQCRG